MTAAQRDPYVRADKDARVLLTLPPRPEGGYPKNETVVAFVTLDGEYDMREGLLVDAHDAYINQSVVELSAGKANWIANECISGEYDEGGERPLLDRYNANGELTGHIARVSAEELQVAHEGSITCTGHFTPAGVLSRDGVFVEAQTQAAQAAEALACERERAYDEQLVRASFQRDGLPVGDVGNYEDVEFIMMAYADPVTGRIDTSKTSLWLNRTDPEGINTALAIDFGGDVYAGVQGNAPDLSPAVIERARCAAGDKAQMYPEMRNAFGAVTGGPCWMIPVKANASFDGYRFDLDPSSFSYSDAPSYDCVDVMRAQGAARDDAEAILGERAREAYETQAKEQAQREAEAERRARNTDIVIPFGPGGTYGQYKQHMSNQEQMHRMVDPVGAAAQARRQEKAQATAQRAQRGQETVVDKLKARMAQARDYIREHERPAQERSM